MHKCDKSATGSKSKYYRWILVWRCVKSWTLVTCKVWSWTHLLCFTSSCNVTFISIQNFINIFFPSSRTDDGRNRKLYIVFSNIPKIVSGVKGRALWWPNHLWKLCLMPDESLHCHLEISLIIREENKSTDGKTWAFSIFRSLLTSFLWACNVAETRLNQPK